MAGKKKIEARIEPKKEASDLVPALLFIPGCFLIGLAIGILINRLLVAILFGLGAGFVLAAISKSLRR